MKTAGDKRLRVKPVRFKVGDLVLVKQQRTNKSMSHFEPVPYRIKSIKGTMITATSKGRSTTRNVSFFKGWRGESGEEEEALPKTPKRQPTMAYNSWFDNGSVNVVAELEDTASQAESSDTDSETLEQDVGKNEESNEESNEDSNEPPHEVTFFISSGDESKVGDEDLLTADEEESGLDGVQKQEAVQVQLGAATGVVQAAVRAFETNDDGTPKSPEQGDAARASRATRNHEVNYRDARPYTKNQ